MLKLWSSLLSIQPPSDLQHVKNLGAEVAAAAAEGAVPLSSHWWEQLGQKQRLGLMPVPWASWAGCSA